MLSRILTMIRRVIGWSIALVCGGLATFFLVSNERLLTIVFAVPAVFGLYLTLRRGPRSRKYEDYRWGKPAPTARQFGYACSLGIPLRNGLTKGDLSRLLSEAEQKQPPTEEQLEDAKELGLKVPRGISKGALDDLLEKADEDQEPADRDQLAIIREYHGVLPRKINYREAEEVIEFLETHHLPCPFCRFEICAMDDRCCACEKSLKKLKIPIKLE
ncbi:MAG: hypothetical protein KF777_01520 [Planctomycetaceae bacterium]|nr:hypothetical protein [Planctomycetaceae bacterium]